jgi:hypothetical protein
VKGKQRRMEMKDVVTGRGGKLFKEINAGPGILIQFWINEQARWIKKYLYALELVYGCVQLYVQCLHIHIGTRQVNQFN